jgi:hypothetical protein
MRDCMQDQKDVESHLKIADILLSHKTVEDSRLRLKEYEKGLEETVQARQGVLQEMRSLEGETRKLQN